MSDPPVPLLLLLLLLLPYASGGFASTRTAQHALRSSR